MAKPITSVRKSATRRAAQASGFRSGLEKRFAAMNPDLDYEPFTMPYEVHEERKYIPDFVTEDGNTIYEVKGRFTSEDRKKMLLLKEQYPDKKFVLVFSRPFNRLTKSVKSKTYAQWCERYGFEWIQFS